jgi:hypothetical protein
MFLTVRLDDLTLGEVLNEAGALFGAALFQDARRETTMLPRRRSILRIWNGCGMSHQRGDVAHGADIDLAARQEGHGAAEIDGEAALDAAEDDALDAGIFLEFGFELVPRGFAAGAVTREDGFAMRVFDAIDIDLDFVADLDVGLHAGHCELAHRHTAFALEADIDENHIVLDAGYGALDDAAFKAAIRTAERFIEKRREIITRRKCRRGHRVQSFFTSLQATRLYPRVFGLHIARTAPCRTNILRKMLPSIT